MHLSYRFVLRMWENGWFDHMRKKYFPPVPLHCLANLRKPDGPKPLKLADFAGAFVMLLIGYGFANLVFISELLIDRLHTNIKKRFCVKCVKRCCIVHLIFESEYAAVK